MRQYELTYLISDLVPESDLNKVTGKIGGYISSLGGKITKEEIWGRRKLAYPIKKQDFATYVTLIFELPADKTKELERNINLTGKIIRHLMIVTKEESEELTLDLKDIAEAKEIEEVVGGEKSFEAIEGETEESRGLMAVRGEAEDKVEEKTVEETPTEEEKAIEPETQEMKVEKKTVKKVKPAKEESKSELKAETKKVKKTAKKESNEADRLSALDKELDDILGDEIK